MFSGRGVLMFHDGAQVIEAGHFIFLPSFCEHGIENAGTGVLLVLLSTAPANP